MTMVPTSNTNLSWAAVLHAGHRRARGTRPRLSHPLVGDLGSGHAVGRRDRRRRVVRLRHGPQHQFVDLRYVVDGDRGPEVRGRGPLRPALRFCCGKMTRVRSQWCASRPFLIVTGRPSTQLASRGGGCPCGVRRSPRSSPRSFHHHPFAQHPRHGRESGRRRDEERPDQVEGEVKIAVAGPLAWSRRDHLEQRRLCAARLGQPVDLVDAGRSVC